MNKTSLLMTVASSLVIGQAYAIEPVFEGDDGILAQVFTRSCLACHSSERSGAARNNAPAGVDFDNYADAVTSGAKAVGRAVVQMNMPPSFSPAPQLNEEQKQALKNWQALGFPEHSLPPIFSFGSGKLDIQEVYLKDANGDIGDKLKVEMTLLPDPGPIKFELTDFQEINDADNP